MNDHLFVDTNVLVYFRDVSEPEKQHLAETWLRAIWEKKLGRLSYQVLIFTDLVGLNPIGDSIIDSGYSDRF